MAAKNTARDIAKSGEKSGTESKTAGLFNLSILLLIGEGAYDVGAIKGTTKDAIKAQSL